MHGLLIVNADDFGGNPLATDRIATCFEIGAITSTTAMVYMQDSERAAAIARSHTLPVGLHLNLTQRYDDCEVPPTIRSRQARLVEQLVKRRQRYLIDPRLYGEVKRCIADQLERFEEQFGSPPTHVDGHNHGHLSPTAALALPRGICMRTAESQVRGRGLASLARWARRRLIAHRQLTTDYFFAIDRIDPVAFEATEDDPMLALARVASVEVMTHPDRDSDFALLNSQAWLSALRRANLGSYRELALDRHETLARV